MTSSAASAIQASNPNPEFSNQQNKRANSVVESETQREHVMINEVVQPCRLDTGADASLIDLESAPKCHCEITEKLINTFSEASGSQSQCIGTTYATINTGDHTIRQKLYVVKKLAERCLLSEDFILKHPNMHNLLLEMRRRHRHNLIFDELTMTNHTTKTTISTIAISDDTSKTDTTVEISIDNNENTPIEEVETQRNMTLEELKAIAANDIHELTPTDAVQHNIKLTDYKPIRQRV